MQGSRLDFLDGVSARFNPHGLHVCVCVCARASVQVAVHARVPKALLPEGVGRDAVPRGRYMGVCAFVCVCARACVSAYVQMRVRGCACGWLYPANHISGSWFCCGARPGLSRSPTDVTASALPLVVALT